MKVAVIVTPGILGFCITAIISAFVFHDRHHRSKGICWECWATGLCKNVWFSTGGCGESLFIVIS